ncbi:hypothetical protein [Polymorphospora sp. NPDC050346]|uniref:hypothetical protein n=1 Tax=Polymorphospora sp. NPDC050346 TaxID=3155780 RepID=UPI0033EEF4B8
MLKSFPRPRRLAGAGLVASGLALLLTVSGATAAGSDVGLHATSEVFIQDTLSDNGAEPSTVSPFWHSPAIKVCAWTPTVPPVECPTSQDQLLIGGSYHVWITLSNTGTTDAVGTLELRRTKPGGGTNWNTDWVNVATKLDVAVPADGVTRIPIQFDNVPGPGHFCLAALWDADGDELKPYPADHDRVVTNDNNIAQRNVNSIAIGKSQSADRSFSMANNQFVRTHTSLIFRPVGTPFHLVGGQIVVDLGPVLFQRWHQAGRRGSGIQQVGTTTQLRLVSTTTARIEELPLDPVERVTVNLRFTAGSSTPAGVYGVEIAQGKTSVAIPCSPTGAPCPPPPDRLPIGGVRYTITVVD